MNPNPIPGGGQRDDSCDSNYDCDGALICEDGVCVEPECQEDHQCDTNRCEDGRCVPECERNSDCGILFGRCENQRCVDLTCSAGEPAPNCAPYGCDVDTGQCRSYCTSNRHCADGYVCDAIACRAPCTRADDPLCKGYACSVSSGVCAFSCTSNQECAAGYVCDGHECWPDLDAPACSEETDAQCGHFACKAELEVCATHCLSNADCKEGYGCVLAYCDFRDSSCGWEPTTECRPTCSAEDESACGAYRCDSEQQVCDVSCLGDDDCAPGYRCDNATYTCVERDTVTSCSDDSVCGAYACGRTGVCFAACRTTSDCSDGALCNSRHECSYPCSTEFDPVCGGYECRDLDDPAACDTKCYNKQNCAPGYLCENERCLPAPSCTSGTASVCGDYACDTSSGRCHVRCTGDAQCVSPATCFLGECI